jgi:hypothetical protein
MMFRCERCGSSFSPIRVSSRQNCPRCRARDGVSIPLTLEMAPFGGFKATGVETDGAQSEKPVDGF